MALNLNEKTQLHDREVLFVSFNQEGDVFSVGTNSGFLICTTKPGQAGFELLQRRDLGGGIGIVEMLQRSNIMTLVGGGKVPYAPPTKLLIWDDDKGLVIHELSFRSEIGAVKMDISRVVVVLDDCIHIYSLQNMVSIKRLDTLSNPKAIMALSTHGSSNLVCPGMQMGRVKLLDLNSGGLAERIFDAHESNLGCIALSSDGTRLATASEKGTLIRVFDTRVEGSPKLLKEMRRGTNQTEIYAMSFSYDSRFLVVSSATSTIHVFDVAEEHISRKSSFSMFSAVSNYFASEWSLAQGTGPIPCVCAFGKENKTVLLVSEAGDFWKFHFDHTKEGEMQVIEKLSLF